MNSDTLIKEFCNSTYTKKYIVLQKNDNYAFWFKVIGLHPISVDEVKSAIKNLAQKYPESEFTYCEMILPAELTITNMVVYQDTCNEDII